MQMQILSVISGESCYHHVLEHLCLLVYSLCFGGPRCFIDFYRCTYSCSTLKSNQGHLKYLHVSVGSASASTMVPGSSWEIFRLFLKLSTCILYIYLSFSFTTSSTVLQCQSHIIQPPAPLTLFTLKLRVKTTSGLSLAPGSSNNWLS